VEVEAAIEGAMAKIEGQGSCYPKHRG
jgi:hypothetical protein